MRILLVLILIAATLLSSCTKKNEIVIPQSKASLQTDKIAVKETETDKNNNTPAETTPSPTPTPAPTLTPEYNFKSFNWANLANDLLEPIVMVGTPLLILSLIGCIRAICCPCCEELSPPSAADGF